jgi:hypothetical protein
MTFHLMYMTLPQDDEYLQQISPKTSKSFPMLVSIENIAAADSTIASLSLNSITTVDLAAEVELTP